jgi:hypothetical protein
MILNSQAIVGGDVAPKRHPQEQPPEPDFDQVLLILVEVTCS